jgi:hypothetical protein
MPKYASECTRGSNFQNTGTFVPLIVLVTRLGWRYREENIFGSLISTRLYKYWHGMEVQIND